MKDLILITNYSNTSEKQNILRRLVNQIYHQKDFFDLMVISHTTIPLDVQEKCSYVFYDSKNELLYDWDLRPKFWFDPANYHRPIKSIFTRSYNTHLTIWRMIILGNSIAHHLGYTKVHHIEYDTSLQDFSELHNNSLLLDTYNSIFYNTKDNLFGSFQSYKLNTLNPELLILDENHIKSQIKNSEVKSPEGMLKDLLTSNKNFLIKERDILDKNGNNFALVYDSPLTLSWCVPYYDKKTNELNFIVWNNAGLDSINITLIYNKTQIFNIDNISQNEWKITTIDLNYDNAKTLIILLNGKFREEFDFTQYKEKFKHFSYREA